MDKLVIGCGYLGERVARQWVAAGQRVYALTRSAERAAELRRHGLVPLVGDVLDPDSLRSLPEAASVLYAVGHDRTAGRSLREVYVTGLANVLAFLPTCDRLLYISSTGVYGQSGGEEVDESAATEPTDESGRVVLEAERLLRGQRPGATILRFAGIYGPGRLFRREAIERGEPVPGDGEQWLNLIHVDDGIAAVLAAEAASPGITVNVSDGHPVLRREFFEELARCLGAPPPRFAAGGPGGPPRHRGHRRIANRRLRQELGVVLRYPSYREGLPASLNPPATHLR
ncbi:MAG: SDR family oxidoreductase [Gemmataceae bacterium]|nr:SDR family oxidoreductase [Gemmataceae bacterium]MDW8263922.1 SDR family oxidoreductase [Gemmataceae bacterium]